jgi:hypothetical protein
MSDETPALSELLRQQLLAAHSIDQETLTRNNSGTILEVPLTGKVVSSAYEQLRNAAEYAEEHLLLQRAIKRFFKRNLFVAKRRQHDLSTELIVDLTQAGYLQGGQFSKATTTTLHELIERHMEAHARLRQAHISRDSADAWILALLSTEAEAILNPHNVQRTTLVVAYHHFLQTIPRQQFTDLHDLDEYEFCLYIAIHLAILKSDSDIIHHDLNRLYKQSPSDTASLITLSRRIDAQLNSPLTEALKRTVSRYGAPFRVLKGLTTDEQDQATSALPDKERFLDLYDTQTDHEYRQLDRRLARGLAKSIVFLIITKLLIGVAVEIPYDLIVYGKVSVLPLAINLLFPPLYLACLLLSFKPPTQANKQALRDYIAGVLYADRRLEIQPLKRRRTRLTTKLIYTLLFLTPIVVTVLILQALHFNLVHMGIFFVFFSTASFLGFRLSLLVRDLELVRPQTGLLASLQDFFYLPFVASGQWLSHKYSRINVVARFMDLAIELPLKSILRLLQQWMNFIREQHEELY